MFRINLKFALACMVVLFAGVACSGQAGLTLENLPIFKDSVKVEPDINSVVAAVISAFETARDQEGVTAEAQVYTVPAGKTWENIKTFYEEELKSEWAENEALMAGDTSEVQQMTWTRKGFLTRDQILVLAWVDDKDTGAKFYMLMLYSK